MPPVDPPPPPRNPPAASGQFGVTDAAAADLFALAVCADSPDGTSDAGVPGYTTLSRVGHGAMGSVWQAVQQSLGRNVALKVIHPQLAHDAAFAARFEREARTLAGLSHPHIVGIHDAGVTADGLMFLSMEWVAGADLGGLLTRHRRLPPGDAVRIFRQVCGALDAAHRAGVIHRDIKPSNILITPEGNAKLADFGIALPPVSSVISLTVSGTVLGTLDYLAPEALSSGFQPDARSDVYAVGVSLYQSLTGLLPKGRFQLPSKIVPGLDPRFDVIVDTALQQEPSGRFPSALAMEQALAAVESRPSQRSRRRALWLVAALSVVALVAALNHQRRGGQTGRSEALPDGKLPAVTGSPVVAPDYPPGRWIPVYQTAREVARLSSGVGWDHGWITPDPAAGGAISLQPTPSPSGRNWGARAVYRWNTAQSARATVSLRKVVPADGGQQRADLYLFAVYSQDAGLFRSRNVDAERHVVTALGKVLHLDLRDGQEVTVEAYAIDGTLYGKVNGMLLEAPTDGALARGTFDLACYGMSFRDLEFINLDGLPVHEAKKAAGLP